MNWIVSSDLHLTDKPQDDHRWGIFDFLAKQQKKHRIKGCLLLGDITDEKDGHSATLVNRMIDGLTKLEPPVYILKGNHDFIDPSNPYFQFLNWVDGIHFITQSEQVTPGIFAVPHQPSQRSFDDAVSHIDHNMGIVLLHGLFEGAISETGQRLSGLSTVKLAARKPRLVLAGDVHKPQQVGIVTYVGAPYRIKFGDNYTPRVLLLED